MSDQHVASRRRAVGVIVGFGLVIALTGILITAFGGPSNSATDTHASAACAAVKYVVDASTAGPSGETARTVHELQVVVDQGSASTDPALSAAAKRVADAPNGPALEAAMHHAAAVCQSLGLWQ